MKWMAIACVLLVGCAHQQLTAPSGGAVTGAISRTQSGVATAQAQQSQITSQAVAALDAESRIDAKDKFLDAYRKWKAGQKP
jgi:hypothetical protein